jgi:hypothetical protein
MTVVAQLQGKERLSIELSEVDIYVQGACLLL